MFFETSSLTVACFIESSMTSGNGAFLTITHGCTLLPWSKESVCRSDFSGLWFVSATKSLLVSKVQLYTVSYYNLLQ